MKPFLPMQPLLLLLLFVSPALAQSKTGKVEYAKGVKMAATIELPYKAEVVQEAIKEFMSRRCSKSDRSKGFDIFRLTKLHENDPEMSDVHCKVEPKRKEKGEAVVYLLIGRPGENITVRTSDDQYKLDEAKRLLNQMIPSIEAYKLEVEIKEQEDLVKKEEKKLQNLEQDQCDLEKKIQALQDKLEQNKLDQKKQADEAARARSVLEQLRGRRKIS